MNTTNLQVRIPQLHKVRRVYEDGDMQYIKMDGEYWGIDGYKKYLKDKYAINITYEFVGIE